MKKYEVNFTDYETGATSPIDTVIKPDGYTAQAYIDECMDNADDEWIEMLAGGTVTLIEVEA